MGKGDGCNQTHDVEIVMMANTNIISNEENNKSNSNNTGTGNDTADQNESNKLKRLRRSASTTEDIAKDVLANLSCDCKTFGCGEFALLFTMLLISGLHFYIYFKYANPEGTTNFIRANMEFIWVFLIFSIIFFLQFLYFGLCWKQIAIKWGRSKYRIRGRSIGENDNIVKQISNLYFSNFGINGKYYLYKLYSYEFVENWAQFTNLISVYYCTLPIEWNALLAAMLIIESVHRCKFMYKKIFGSLKTKQGMIDVGERNFQVKLDIGIDLFFVVVPLFLIQAVYGMQISAPELIRIIIMPSFSLVGKLRALFQHGLFDRIVLNINKKEEAICVEKNRRRQSMYAISLREKIANEQNKYFPRLAKMTVFGMSFIYVLVLVVMVVGQLATISFLNTCDAETFKIKDVIWNNGCRIKIPFCNRPFNPKCNCAHLKIEGEKNLTELPDNVVSEMDGLRKVEITNCSLKTLPSKMERLTEMVDFSVTFNKLNAFDVNISKWEKLITLALFNNNITRYDEKALWTHGNVVGVDLANNVGLKIPRGIGINMPLLQYLNLDTNGMTLNVNFNEENFPNLMMLFLNGNKLLKFPDKSLRGKIIWLAVARCNLKSLPMYLSEFKLLKYLDARDNNITYVDDGLRELIQANKVESYFSGNNMICSTDTSLDCKPLCSKYCWSRHVSNDKYCDVECNSYECDYDGGDCKSSVQKN